MEGIDRVPAQTEMLPLLLRVLDARAMTGSEAQRKLLLGHATLLAYCLRWQDFRARACARQPHPPAYFGSSGGWTLPPSAERHCLRM